MIYMAYGANLDPLYMRERCPDAKLIGEGFLRGYELAFCGQPGKYFATIVTTDDGADHVPALLWRISDAEERALDSYVEEFHGYRKERVQVSCDGRRQSGYAYVMHCCEGGFPTLEHFNHIQHGYDFAQFDIYYLYEALRKVDPERYYAIEKYVLENMKGR